MIGALVRFKVYLTYYNTPSVCNFSKCLCMLKVRPCKCSVIPQNIIVESIWAPRENGLQYYCDGC